VSRADWHEEKQLFVVSCSYPKRRIFPAEYEAFLNDPEWKKTDILG
jgi:hypothetical protein